MKKSEKIELRVDFAEKERLSKIAERRGQTISDVVRDALAGKLSAAPQPYPKWPGIAAIGAIVLAAGSLLWTATGGQGNAHEGPPMTTASLMMPDTGGEPILDTQVPHRDGFSKTYEINTGLRQFQFTHDVSEISSDVFELKAILCVVSGEDCVPEGESSMILAAPSTPPRLGQMVARNGDGIAGDKSSTNNVFFLIETLGPSLEATEVETP